MSKDKWVRRFSVDETTRHKNGFTIYKITSVLFPIESPEAMSVVSVWKRYSDVKTLHASMKSLHAGLHLRGTFPALPKFSYFKRFQQEVIEERAKVIKTLLEFIAEHKLLFTSTDFVNFLQSGYPAPERQQAGVIDAIRSSLQLPVEQTPPLEYHSDDDSVIAAPTVDEPDFAQIPIYTGIETDSVVKPAPVPPRAGSFESIDSLESIGSDLYSDLEKVKIEKHESLVKRNVLPDLINFDVPSTSRFDDYHTHNTNTNSESDSISLTSSSNQRSEQNLSANQHSETNISTNQRLSFTRSNSRVSNRSMLSFSNVPNVDSKTKTEDSYVFEAGYMLNLAARYEDMKEYSRAFECYKAGIEKMLIGVQADSDPARRALIKEKTNKYLSYAEHLYKNHLANAEHNQLLESEVSENIPQLCPIPTKLLRRPYEDLSLYRVVCVLSASVMLVLHRGEHNCYAMKVIQKIPNNLTEFDEYFLQNTNETRQPILPTVIPYMVPLHAYIETNNLIFLILSYAPGQKLMDYIKNYIKSTPNTPAREVNLENIFTEPKIKATDIKNENLNSIIEIKTETKDSEISIIEKIEINDNSNNNCDTTDNIEDLHTKELVKNSQNLLRDVEKVLSEVSVKDSDCVSDVKLQSDKEVERGTPNVEKVERINTPLSSRVSPSRASRDTVPSGTICAWGAQILTALESLHNCGVICRDLNPSNILLGEQGQVILTYFLSYSEPELYLHKWSPAPSLYLAPELYCSVWGGDGDGSGGLCDYWSFGAVMYELLCGVPLSYYHRSVFTSHTILYLPPGLPIEVQSLLTQLLTYSPSERLGSGPDGIQEIKRHPYFKHIHWNHVYNSWKIPG